MDVFILDTAPSQQKLAAAYQRWHSTNPLIASLLGPGGPLRLHLIDTVEQHLAVDVDDVLPDHQYQMPDHGLFVAGIIHTIAPRATLHLVRVLDDYGRGSYESILHGLQFIHQSANDLKTLVNMSLCFNLVQPDETWLWHWSMFDPFWAGGTPRRLNGWPSPLTGPVSCSTAKAIRSSLPQAMTAMDWRICPPGTVPCSKPKCPRGQRLETQ